MKELEDFLMLLDDKYKAENIRKEKSNTFYSAALIERYNKWMDIRKTTKYYKG